MDELCAVPSCPGPSSPPAALAQPPLPSSSFTHSLLHSIKTTIISRATHLLPRRSITLQPFLPTILLLCLVCPPVVRAVGGRPVSYYVPLRIPLLLLLGMH